MDFEWNEWNDWNFRANTRGIPLRVSRFESRFAFAPSWARVLATIISWLCIIPTVWDHGTVEQRKTRESHYTARCFCFFALITPKRHAERYNRARVFEYEYKLFTKWIRNTLKNWNLIHCKKKRGKDVLRKN